MLKKNFNKNMDGFVLIRSPSRNWRYNFFTWRLSDCEELVGEVNHTTECVTDLFWIVDFEWTIVWSNHLDSLLDFSDYKSLYLLFYPEIIFLQNITTLNPSTWLVPLWFHFWFHFQGLCFVKFQSHVWFPENFPVGKINWKTFLGRMIFEMMDITNSCQENEK